MVYPDMKNSIHFPKEEGSERGWKAPQKTWKDLDGIWTTSRCRNKPSYTSFHQKRLIQASKRPEEDF